MTAPFGEALVFALREPKQGGKLYLLKGTVFNPQFYCCISGASMGVNKDPVARLSLSVTQVCAGDPVTANYSRSWSPTSTLNNWSVSWGDGNVSNGAWPGAGSVAHPLGGYVWPGTYTVTLTVTDLLGATHRDTVQIVVLDCTVCDIEMMGGCGASGVWYSLTGGISWEDVSDSLEGVEVYDLKVSPFDSGYMWAATAEGLYRDTLTMQGWERVTLPDPAGGNDEPVAYAIQPSTVMPTEVYIFAFKVSTNETYVFRAVGVHRMGWSWLRVGVASLAVDHTVLSTYVAWADSFAVYDDHLWFGFGYIGGGVPPCHSGYSRKDLLGNWVDYGYATVPVRPGRFAVYDGKLYGLWYDAAIDCLIQTSYGIQVYNGAAWSTVNWQPLGYGTTPDVSLGKCIVAVEGQGVYCVSGNIVRRYINTVEAGATNALAWGTMQGIDYFDTDLYCISKSGGTYRIYRYSAGAWVQEYESVEVLSYLVVYDDHIWCVERNQLRVKVRQADGTWIDDDYEMPASDNATAEALHVEDDVMYATARDQTPAPDVNWVYRRVEGFGWVAIHANVDANYPLYGPAMFNDEQHYHTGGATVMVPLYSGLHLSTIGRTHLMAMSLDGYYIYLGLLNVANQPVICRVAYDLSGVVTLHDPLAGTWGGVAIDPNYADRLWIFGDFGAASKVLLSEDWGITLVDMTDGGWGANEVVRPVMPSMIDPEDVIAILNTALESWRSLDGATTWLKTGDTAFVCGCGVRDYFDPLNIFIGHAGPAPTGVNHIQYSPNAGVGWIERSTGFEADAPVPSLEIVS